MIELISNTKIDFMGKRNVALAASCVLILLGIFAVFQIASGSANLGIDFAGGTAVQIKFIKPVPLQEVRQTLTGGGMTDFDLQDLPSENKILIRTKKSQDSVGNISEKMISILGEKYSAENIIVDSSTEIGPKVGARLRTDAMWAIVASIIGILIYVTIRFQFRFGIGATFATFHDVMAVLGIFYLMGKEINLILVSALLMIAGYSLTDTVVVFDRIRDNLKYSRKKTAVTIVNESLNEVLSRTIITSLTTLFSALALYIVGGEVIHDFAFAIIIGIIIGTYSSMYVASPIVLLMGKGNSTDKK